VAVASGFVAVSVSLYPVTPTLSVAVKDEIETVNEVEVAGIVNEETVGSVVSEAGLLAAFPGKVLALISTILVKVSLSESCGSIVAKL
jgi:hypothetical protein